MAETPTFVATKALSALSGVAHGFFTRRGGVSEGVYGSLNCGPGSGDDPARVADNRARVLAALSLPKDALATASQVHSATALVVETPFPPDARPEVDALVTRTPGLALGVLTADCAPVLLADPEARVVAAVHAGWKGALSGVLDAAFDLMRELGAEPGRTVAAVGPAIAFDSYEVGFDLRERFVETDPANERFFMPSFNDGHFMFDLPAFVRGRLKFLGVGTIEDAYRDTYEDEDHFFSYRRTTHQGGAGGDYGRQISVIALSG